MMQIIVAWFRAWGTQGCGSARRGVASGGPHATSGGLSGSAGELREARFHAQVRANRHICSESGVQFSKKIEENRPMHPKAPQGNPKGPSREPQGTPRDPRGTPEGAPGDSMGPPRGPRAAQREPSGRQNQAKGTPKPVQGQPKQAKRTNYISKKLPINRLRRKLVMI